MKHIVFSILMTGFISSLFAQSALLPINQECFHSDFLRSITKFPIGSESQDSGPVYSCLTWNAPNIKWSFYGDDAYVKSYKVSVAKGWPLESANDLRFVVSAYTKGDFVLAICSIESFCDINEQRLYTYDYYGHVIDSLILQHDFLVEGGRCIMPLAGALMGNLDVMICEIKWAGTICPYSLKTRNIVGGCHLGQRFDSYYTLDETGHFILKRKTIYYSKVYTEDDVTMLDLSLEETIRKPVFRTVMPIAAIQEVIEY